MTRLKIGILGSRGIPNAYGGFEQFAQSLSLYLIGKGHNVYVYNSSLHPYKESTWQGVNIIHCYDMEERIGTAGQFIYDLNCILHSRKQGFDVLLQLGYTSSAVWGFLLPSKPIIVTNMDGLEWMRSKYSKTIQKFLKLSEKWAANSSDVLVADSLGIQDYLRTSLSKESFYIAYGATIFDGPDVKKLAPYKIEKNRYFLLIARMEPENNIETILKGYVESNSDLPFLVIGNIDKSYGQSIYRQFKNSRVQFLGSIYDQDLLNNLRFFSKAYFHGHSVGGTNPSLLEAMASSAFIYSHDNPFNKSILDDDALYFKTSFDITEMLNDENSIDRSRAKKNNLEKIKTLYSEELINSKYEDLFNKIYAQL